MKAFALMPSIAMILWEQSLSIPAAGSARHTSQSSLGHWCHLHTDASRLRLSDRCTGLVFPPGAFLASF